MAFVSVGLFSKLPPGSVTEVLIGDAAYAVCNVDGELHALAGECPHAHGPVGQGYMNGHYVVCPWHEWGFDCRTGANTFDPRVRLDRFAVKVAGDEILIDPEEHA